jgi:hypothetical protein
VFVARSGEYLRFLLSIPYIGIRLLIVELARGRSQLQSRATPRLPVEKWGGFVPSQDASSTSAPGAAVVKGESIVENALQIRRRGSPAPR